MTTPTRIADATGGQRGSIRLLVSDLVAIYDYWDDWSDTWYVLARWRCALLHRGRLVRERLYPDVSAVECIGHTGWWAP